MFMAEAKNRTGYFVKLLVLGGFVAYFFFCHQGFKGIRKHKEETLKV